MEIRKTNFMRNLWVVEEELLLSIFDYSMISPNGLSSFPTEWFSEKNSEDYNAICGLIKKGFIVKVEQQDSIAGWTTYSIPCPVAVELAEYVKSKYKDKCEEEKCANRIGLVSQF